MTGDVEFIRYHFIPLKKVHLIEEENLQYVYIISALGILILIMAGIDYINLATARAMDCIKEVCVKKMVGANKKHLLGSSLVKH